MDNKRYSDPITYILDAFLNKKEISEFDIRNASDQWLKLKNKKPVAFALDNGDGDLYDLRKFDNPYNDRTKVVPLYRDIT